MEDKCFFSQPHSEIEIIPIVKDFFETLNQRSRFKFRVF